MNILFQYQYVLFSVISILLVLGIFIYIILPRVIIETSHPFLKQAELLLAYETSGLKGEQIDIVTQDNYQLSAFIAKTDIKNPLGTIILIHGITRSKELFIPLSKYLAKQGFNSVALDLRAHGKSQGQYTTFGYYEKQDISILITELEKRGFGNVGIWGQSLGGATSIQALAYDKRLKFGIIESTFSDLNNVIHVYFKHYLGFNYRLLSEFITKRAGEIGNFDPNLVVPFEDCKKIDQPVLMVHGEKDKKISIASGLKNFNNLKSKVKKFLAIKQANHINVWETAGQQLYFSKVVSFIKKNSQHNIIN